ncbi:MAG TPA: fluoride efflux transporter CrcB [Chitinophagaceae bacterium]
MINQLLLVGLGGGIGSIARWLCQRYAAVLYPHHYPLGTWIVNIVGCFLIGIFWGRLHAATINWKLFLMIGLCGGFTTFSAFTLESIGLIKQEKHGLFFLYIAASVLGGLAATYAGMKLSR